MFYHRPKEVAEALLLGKTLQMPLRPGILREEVHDPVPPMREESAKMKENHFRIKFIRYFYHFAAPPKDPNLAGMEAVCSNGIEQRRSVAPSSLSAMCFNFCCMFCTIAFFTCVGQLALFASVGGNLLPMTRAFSSEGLGAGGVAGWTTAIAAAWPEDLRMRVDTGEAYVAGMEYMARTQDNDARSDGGDGGGRVDDNTRRRSIGVFRTRGRGGSVRARLPVTMRIPYQLIDLYQVLCRWLAVRTSTWQFDSLFASGDIQKYVFGTTEAVRPLVEFYDRANPPT